MENTKDLALGSDVRQSVAYGKFMEGIGWKTLISEGVQIFIRKVGPVNIAKIQRIKLPVNWEKIFQDLKKYRVIMYKLEPEHDTLDEQVKEIKRLGFKPDNWPMLGTKTLLVDLRGNDEERTNKLGSDTRYKIRKLEKMTHNIELNNHNEFYEIFKKAFAIKHIWMPPRSYYDNLVKGFGDEAFCMTVDGLCGCLILINGQLASYFYGATLPKAKENNLPYLLIWEAMKEAKKRGAKVWDFEGIFDPRWPNNGWKGFSYFKERFAGEIVNFPGSFTKWNLKSLLGI